MVFGGLGKRFKFKNEWYVLADYMYKYDETYRTLSKTASNLVLRIDNESTITIYGKNLPYNANKEPYILKDKHDDYMNNVWYNLKINNVKIDNGEIYHEWNHLNYYEYLVNYRTGSASGTIEGIKLNDVYAKWAESLTLSHSGRGKTYTYDLLNWKTETNYKVISTPIYFPSPSLNINSKNHKNFNGSTGMKGERIVYFKGYIYVLGGYTEISDNGLSIGDKKRVNITTDKYHRIKAGLDTANPDNWEVFNAIDGLRRAWAWTRVDNSKLYVNDGFRVYADVDLGLFTKDEDRYSQSYSHDFVGNIYSSYDGVNWNLDSEENYYRASYIDYEPEFDINVGPPQNPLYSKRNIDFTPLEYIYAELDGKYYVITPNEIKIPENKIKTLSERGDTNFFLDEEDIKNISIYQLISFNGSEDKVITVVNPISSSLLWVGGSEYIFNFNGKLIRLVDYANTNQFREYPSKAASMLSSLNYWKNIVELGGFTNNYLQYTKNEACYYYLNTKAWYDIYNFYSTNSRYFMPNQAITHYSIDFRY